MNALVEITLDGEVPADHIEQMLAADFAVAQTESYRATLRFHDTFDWRLYRAGWVLEENARASNGTLH